MKLNIITLALIATLFDRPRVQALEIDINGIAQKGGEALNSVKDRVAEIDWEALRQDGANAIDQIKSQVAEVDWKDLHQKGIGIVDQAKSQVAAVDWQGLLQIGNELSQVEWEKLRKKLLEILENIKNSVLMVELSKLPSDLLDWIKEHPGDTVFYVVSGVVFFYPAIVSGPLLELLGFAAKGPVGGSLAALAHATIGNVPARHVFSYLQSAAMGGYGVFPVEMAVRGAAAAAIAAKYWSEKGVHAEEVCLKDDLYEGCHVKSRPKPKL
ncbi:MAG: hypothetical protein M1813_000003 [Trichoglossum hirsutum]|nr:MAG: hypothetical protein M1813_000003 [Trichoglossum hirsutum]